ncbi:hypothetical protein NC651_032591 [Populus alba x Populus x berolinensis]|nr:hypothetical protein NC651_032591 [Populus alba x Populus x berolinensis]
MDDYSDDEEVEEGVDLDYCGEDYVNGSKFFTSSPLAASTNTPPVGSQFTPIVCPTSVIPPSAASPVGDASPTAAFPPMCHITSSCFPFVCRVSSNYIPCICHASSCCSPWVCHVRPYCSNAGDCSLS